MSSLKHQRDIAESTVVTTETEQYPTARSIDSPPGKWKSVIGESPKCYPSQKQEAESPDHQRSGNPGMGGTKGGVLTQCQVLSKTWAK